MFNALRAVQMHAPAKIPELVIFDCDGVLVDSEPIFNRILHEFLISCGAELTSSECSEIFTGKSRHDVEIYLSTNGVNIPEDWAGQFYRQALQALEREVEPIPGVVSVLQKLREVQVTFCVASNGIQEKMNVTLTRTLMRPYFEGNIFSAYDIGESKPAPDVFLHAARANGVQPENCVVVEDSPSGFEAASNAQMRCLAYLPKQGKGVDDLFGAHGFNDMKDLPRLLGLD
jgi:HAD superfamily hydrolase (TIGR01509 family)